MSHTVFTDINFFSNIHRENKTTPTFATSAGEPGQISRNYPTEAFVHIQHVPLENIVLMPSLMVFALTALCCILGGEAVIIKSHGRTRLIYLVHSK